MKPGNAKITNVNILKTSTAVSYTHLDVYKRQIKGCEWIRSDTPPGSGDAQHYQNIVLSGVDADGQDVTNEVSYLVLDLSLIHI